MATEDSSLAILSLRTGELVARPLRPKNTSTPLDLALLDVHGVPIFPSMGPVVLPWADNNAAAAPRSLKMMSTLSRGGGRSLGSEQTQADSVTASLRLPTANSLEVQELPTDTDDDDLDSHLDAAAAAADAETSTKGSKLRFSLFRRRSASPDKLQSAAKSVSSAQESSPTRTPAGSVAGRGTAVPEVHSAIGTPPTPVPSPYLEDPAGPGGFNGFSGHVEEEDIDTSADLWGQDKAAPHPDVQGFALEALQGEAVDYPFFAEAVGAEQVPTVCYVLLATAEYLRVYSVDTLLSGDRTTERKARLATPAIFAGWFLAEHGPGVATVSQSNVLSVHSVPNLEPLVTQQLAAPSALGFEWHSPGDAACTAWACSLDGQLLLTAPGNELVRLTTVKQCAVPVGAASTFDWDLAKAAKAAAAMVGDASPALGRGSRAASLDAPAPSPENGATSRGASFINSVKGAASGLVDSAAAATGAMRQEFDRVRGLPPRELPTLRALFEKPVTSLEEEDDIDFIPEEEESGRNSALGKAAGMAADAAGIAGEKAVAVAGKAKDLASAAMAGAVQQGAKLKNMIPNPMTKRSASIDEPEAPALEPTSKERRNELLGTPPTGYNRSRTPEPGSRGTSAPRPAASFGGYSSGGRRAPKLHKRTTSEIKREYGHSRAQDARAVMERNRALLAERGQKLANLEEKSAAMQNDAEDFAGLAQELEAAFANRKWWHF